MEEIKITRQMVQAAYRYAKNNSVMLGVLRSLFGDEVKPEPIKNIMERVRTYEDACRELGIEAQTFMNMPYDVVAYIKLCTITKALNEGWEPTHPKGVRYYPSFYLHSQECVDEMSADEKRKLKDTAFFIQSGQFAAISRSSYSISVTSDTCYPNATRLFYRTDELAQYSGNQFIDIWADFILIKNAVKKRWPWN